ncbi:heme exporter protein CcmD [Actibacterium lipolyticum]|uniref:Heme exporter protein D n=1 Tax=Actibacterium lipolyticum TaxID=1524263 RepID=A0A238KHE7_9RHOB|nr:heme exporter protein CcmD [Actibacterium lipolyticum]SMX42245.1 Heme exporter protein D (CcmD) [Actibacterium lipolyticum]
MMPDLGKYAGAVLSSYGLSLIALALLVGLSLLKSASVRKQLDAAEKRREKHG